MEPARLARLALRPAQRAFAEWVEYRPQHAPAFQVRGVFNAAHTALSGEGEVDFSTTAPSLGIVDSDFPAPPRQFDRIVIRGRVYEVVDVQPDGPNIGSLLILTTTHQRPDGRKPDRIDSTRRITDHEGMD